MCTTGVMRIGDGDYLLFKNKDFGRTHFDDRLVTEPDVFGVRGVSTWAGTDPDRDEFSGFSIGANAHGLLCCDSNVRTLDGHANSRRSQGKANRWRTVPIIRFAQSPVLLSPCGMILNNSGGSRTMAAEQLRTNEVAYEKDFREQLERDHHGKTALMHDGRVVDVYDDPNDAYLTGHERWGLGGFSMKEIGQKPIELGIFSARLA